MSRLICKGRRIAVIEAALLTGDTGVFRAMVRLLRSPESRPEVSPLPLGGDPVLGVTSKHLADIWVHKRSNSPKRFCRLGRPVRQGGAGSYVQSHAPGLTVTIPGRRCAPRQLLSPNPLRTSSARFGWDSMSAGSMWTSCTIRSLSTTTVTRLWMPNCSL